MTALADDAPDSAGPYFLLASVLSLAVVVASSAYAIHNIALWPIGGIGILGVLLGASGFRWLQARPHPAPVQKAAAAMVVAVSIFGVLGGAAAGFVTYAAIGCEFTPDEVVWTQPGLYQATQSVSHGTLTWILPDDGLPFNGSAIDPPLPDVTLTNVHWSPRASIRDVPSPGGSLGPDGVLTLQNVPAHDTDGDVETWFRAFIANATDASQDTVDEWTETFIASKVPDEPRTYHSEAGDLTEVRLEGSPDVWEFHIDLANEWQMERLWEATVDPTPVLVDDGWPGDFDQRGTGVRFYFALPMKSATLDNGDEFMVDALDRVVYDPDHWYRDGQQEAIKTRIRHQFDRQGLPAPSLDTAGFSGSIC